MLYRAMNDRQTERSDAEITVLAASQPSVAEILDRVTPSVRRALVSRYGVEVGTDAAADAIAWGWEHADSIVTMANPGGYLYRVGQTSARRAHRRIRRSAFPVEPVWEDAPELPGDVFDALHRLKPDQRVSVLMVHGYGFSYRETAELMDVSEAAVRNHLHRGMERLRSDLERNTERTRR